MSHQGEIRTAPAGMGNPESRMTWSPAMHSPPPAESPEKTMLDGETGVCNAPGGGCMRYRSIRRLDYCKVINLERRYVHDAMKS